MEGYFVEFLIVVYAVVVRNILGGDEVAGSVLSGGSLEDTCVGNIDCLRPV